MTYCICTSTRGIYILLFTYFVCGCLIVFSTLRLCVCMCSYFNYKNICGIFLMHNGIFEPKREMRMCRYMYVIGCCAYVNIINENKEKWVLRDRIYLVRVGNGYYALWILLHIADFASFKSVLYICFGSMDKCILL